MKPTQEQVIAWAREATGKQTPFASDMGRWAVIDRCFAIAYEAGQKDALSNIDPSKLMSYQEGYEAGRKDENEACAELIPPQYFELRDRMRARREQ